MDSCFEAQIPQKFEDLWGKSLALKNILGFFLRKKPHLKKNSRILKGKKPRPGKNFFGPPQSQNPTSLPGNGIIFGRKFQKGTIFELTTKPNQENKEVIMQLILISKTLFICCSIYSLF